jgi:hypothetical protein
MNAPQGENNMNEETARLKQDLQTIELALGLDIWTRRDVRRGLLGSLAGGGAGLFLALWNFWGGQPVAGLIAFLVMLYAVIFLKDFGYRRSPAPSAGTQREVAFYFRYYFIGALVVSCYYFWGQSIGMAPQTALASTVVMWGVLYVFYAISAPSRSICLAGAVSLTVCGFLLPEAHDLSQMLAWLGVAACIGCWLESALMLMALGRKGGQPGASGSSAGTTTPPPPSPPVPGQPETPLLGHAAH